MINDNQNILWKRLSAEAMAIIINILLEGEIQQE